MPSLAPARVDAGADPAPSRLVASLAAGEARTVVVYGTSLSADTTWAERTAAELRRRYPGDLRLLNRARGSASSRWGLQNLEERVIQAGPDAVFLEFAVNDAYRPYEISLDRSRRNLERMIDRIRESNAECEIVVLLLAQPRGRLARVRPALERYQRVHREVARDRKVILVEPYVLLRSLQRGDAAEFVRYVPDGLHLSVLADEQVVVPAILRALGVP